MKRNFITMFIIMLIGTTGFAQLSGIKNIPGDYATLKLAIHDLNTQGVAAPGVIFNVAADLKEAFSSPLDGRIATLTGSVTSPITFQKSGLGANPLITAATGEGIMDAVFSVAGSDYVTFDGISVVESDKNYDETTWMEWGFAILKASGSNGSQNVTIKNCTVTLEKYNPRSIGIYSNNHTTGSVSQLTVTAVGGANSALKLFGNTIANSYKGIFLRGFASSDPFNYYDQNNEIGKDGANYITNVGGGDSLAYGIYTIYQNNLKVANNQVTGVTENFKSLYGIYLTTASNASYDLYGNTVSIQFTSTEPFGNTHFYPIYCDMGANGSTNEANIYNNTVTNCSFPVSQGSASTRCMFLLNMGVTANVYGNVISNNTIGGDGSSSASGEIRYMWVQKASSTPGPLVVHDNIVTGNERIQPTPAFGSTYMLAIVGSGTTLNAYNNLINNNIVTSLGGTYCLYVPFSDAVLKEVHNNTITNITQANGSVTALTSGNGTLGLLYNNKIQGITSAPNAENASITGIYHTSGSTPAIKMYYYNNFISELSNPGTAGTLGYDYIRLNGIYCEAGSTAKGFYNNTIFLNSPAYANDFGSSAFCAENLSNVDLRNNIFVNTSMSTGLGRTVGIRSRNTSFSGYTSNYNNIYAGDTLSTSNLIFYNGVQAFQTLLAYQTQVSPNEVQSVTELPHFLNVATSPYDLHLSTSIPTKCEGNGIVVSTPVDITTDFDGDPRFPNPGYPVNPLYVPSAPDLGADEFGGITIDVSAPTILYTPLIAINNGNPRTLTAHIIDASGVPVSGFGLPMLYWKKNNGAYLGVQGVFLGSDNYSFTFGGGAVLSDVIYYYIVAQDNQFPPKVGAYPWQGAAGFSANPPTCATPPTSPSSYVVISDISGIRHVGVGKDYATLTAAAADLNAKYMTGPVTFILDDNTYPTEIFPIKFNGRPGNSIVNTLTIKPNTGANPVISGASAAGILVFNGLDFVILDGSNNGSSNKNLTVENWSTANYAHTIGITNNNGTDPSKSITIKNSILTCSNTALTMETYVILFNYNGGLSGGGYDNCLITNNTIMRSKYGMFITGSAGNMNRDIVVSNNIFGSVNPADYITRFGVAVDHSDNTLIAGNDIMGPAQGIALDQLFGIYYGNNVANTKIHNNKIHDFYSFGLGSYGIKCSNQSNATPTEIFNNLFYNFKCIGMNPGPSNNNSYGIFVRTGSNMKIWNNSIYLSGPYLDGFDSYAPSSACICFYDAASINIDIRDNIMVNTMTNPTNPPPGSGATGRAYGIQMANTAASFTNLDYNIYNITGYHGTIAQKWTTGFGNPIEFETLAAFQAYTGKDAHSDTLNPVFVSGIDPINLHPTNLNLNSTGGPKLLDTDYASATRYNPCDIGAFEWSSLVTSYHTLAATNVDQTLATLNGDINTNGEVVEAYFDYGTTTSYGTTVSLSPSTVRSVGALLPVSAPITGLLPNTTYHFRFWGIPTTSGQANIYGTDMTFTTTGSVPVNTTVNSSYSNDTCFNASQTITVAGSPNTFTVTPTGSVTMIAGQNIVFLPGSAVQPGGYLHGYISTEYCGALKSPLMATKMGEEEMIPVSGSSLLRVYPNPTSGLFTLEINGATESERSNVEIFSMHGEKVLSTENSWQRKLTLSLTDKPTGIYLIRVTTKTAVETLRIIRQK